MARTICDGLTVVELGAGSAAGSFAGMMLADNGARVLKIEPPEGDRLRTADPSAFLVWNRGKESVIADLRTDAGRAQVRALIGSADVVIEAFAAGQAEAWGLGYDDVSGDNPGLVYCAVKGFASNSGYAHLKAYEGIVAAKVGVYSIGNFGVRSGPIFAGAPHCSVGAAHFATSGIAVALFVREQTGRGQRVEATMAQGITPMNYFGLMQWQLRRHPELVARAAGERSPREGGIGAVRTAFAPCTADGRWVHFTQMLPKQAQGLMRAAGVIDQLADPRFKDAPFFGSAEDGDAWETMIWEQIRELPWTELRDRLLAEPDVSFELVGTDEDGLDHAQIRHNGERIVVHDPVVGDVEQTGPVAHYRNTPAVVERPAPALGAHGELPTAPAARRPDGGAAPQHPLSGTTIVEFGYFYATPFGLTIAAALGARVIKLEPREGDPQRSSFGTPEFGGVKAMEGKESLSIDMSTPEGQAIVHRIVANADAFVCGFRPGVPEKLKVDYETLKQVNPDLLYFHAAGYGVDGPYSMRPTYANEAAAVGGAFYRNGGFWLDPALAEGMGVPELQAIIQPRIRGLTPGDAYAAMALGTGLTLGLLDRRRSGEGQFATRSMCGANAFGYSDSFVRYAGKPPTRIPDSEQLGLGALYRNYQTTEGWVFLAVATEKEWQALVGAVGADLATDDRFATAEARQANDDALAAALEKVFATKTAAEWESLLGTADVACVKVFETSDPEGVSGMCGLAEFTYTDPVMREAGETLEVDHPLFGPIVRDGLPVTFSETPGRAAPGPLVGQHTGAILAELGYSPDEIAKLEANEVVFSR